MDDCQGKRIGLLSLYHASPDNCDRLLYGGQITFSTTRFDISCIFLPWISQAN